MENETMGGYFASIQKYPLLSAEEEKKLSEQIESGNKRALSCLINSNLRLVVSVARRFQVRSSNMMDLIQEGNMGLMVAAKKFRAAFKTRFSTYAYPWIAQYMFRYMNNRSSMITLPHRKKSLISKIQGAQNYLFQQVGHEVSTTELALYTGIPEDKIVECLHYSYSVVSLDIDASEEDNSVSIGDLVADMTYCPENLLVREEIKENIHSMMEMLPGNEAKVIRYRYNFDGDLRTKTLREISKIIGVSPEAVRQTELRAVRHMKAVVAKSQVV